MLNRILGAFMVVAAAAPGAFAAELGDPAAPLAIAEWVKGEPVDLATGKGSKVYVVEFWATWCPPCRESIPHLSELQAKYKDQVTFIGITDEDSATVKPFVDEKGAQMDYHVAIDDSNKTTTAYMQAYGMSGIPTAFVVDKEGRVAWVGHPMDDLEGTIDGVLAGTYDIAKAKEAKAAAVAREEKIGGFIEKMEQGRIDEANAEAKAVLDSGTDDEELLIMTGWIMVAVPDTKGVDFKLAKQLIEAGIKASDEDLPVHHVFYGRALFVNGDHEGAYASMNKAIAMETDPDRKAQIEQMLESLKAEAAAPVVEPAI